MADSKRVRELFERLVDLTPAARESLISAEATDADTVRAVRELLDFTREMPTRFLGAAPDLSGTPPRQLGPYTLGGLLGEGGMGRVYRAQQRAPIQRTVAVKLIKPGFDSRDIISRFESERDTLSRLDHPNIAKVLDAGSTDAQQPYFVVEFVPGVAITRFCDEQRLNIDDRLRLFTQVCDAIAHAHTKGVIHRDLKPSNVMAFMQDGRPMVKVIDFGIAKLLDRPETAKTFHTRTGIVLGTYEYMSPEQAAGSGDIDTRSDVYSLGVLLYELLVGALPFSADTYGRAADREIRRIVSEDEPPRPAARLSAMGDTATLVAERRDVRAAQLGKLLAGELEWIPLKALRKERERRYAGATELRSDLENYLAGRPLIAAPESMVYRARKFTRRHRLAVTLSATTLLLVATAATLYFVGVTREQRRTLAALEQNYAVNAFLQDMLSSIDPSRARGEPALVRDVVARADAEMDRQVGLAASSRAGLRLTLAQTLLSIGQPQQALVQLDKIGTDPAALDAENAVRRERIRAAALRELGRFGDAESVIRAGIKWAGEHFDSTRPVMIELRGDLGAIQLLRGHLADASATLAAAIANAAALPAERQIEIGYQYARATRAIGRPRSALLLYQSALVQANATLGRLHPTTIAIEADAGDLLRTLGLHADAESLLTDALARARRVTGDDHPLTLRCANADALLLFETDRPEQAAELARATLAQTTTRFGGDHPDAIDQRATIASLLDAAARRDESEAMWHDVYDARRRVLGDEHPDTLDAASSWGWLMIGSPHRDQARALLAHALTTSRRVLGDDHPVTLGLLSNYASSFDPIVDTETVLALYADLLERRTRTAPDGVDIIGAYNNYANVLRVLDRREEALAFDVRCLEARKRTFGPQHSWVLQSYNNLALTLMALGRNDEAEHDATLAWEGRVKALGAAHPATLNSLNTLAMASERVGKLDVAERYFRDALDGRRKALGEHDSGTMNAKINLGSFLQRHGQPAEAEPLLRAAYADALNEFGPTHPGAIRVARRLGFCLDALGRSAEANALRAAHHIERETPEAAVAMPAIK